MRKILIVEDDQNIASLERDYLEANGYQVDVETNGLKGMDKALQGTYDLILLDVMLPGTDGFEICRQVRKEKDIPVLFVTAKKEEIDKIRGLGIGADDYVVKPFSPSELVARVNAHINRYERLSAKQTDQSDVIAVGGLTIEKKARRVFLDDQEIMLANKEFDLLVFLASHPNVVFSKDTLFDKIWGFDSLGETSTVTVHINRLREKIEKNMSNPEYIETVWGAGYRFRG